MAWVVCLALPSCQRYVRSLDLILCNLRLLFRLNETTDDVSAGYGTAKHGGALCPCESPQESRRARHLVRSLPRRLRSELPCLSGLVGALPGIDAAGGCPAAACLHRAARLQPRLVLRLAPGQPVDGPALQP